MELVGVRGTTTLCSKLLCSPTPLKVTPSQPFTTKPHRIPMSSHTSFQLLVFHGVCSRSVIFTFQLSTWYVHVILLPVPPTNPQYEIKIKNKVYFLINILNKLGCNYDLNIRYILIKKIYLLYLDIYENFNLKNVFFIINFILLYIFQ